ncbi:MAG: hypothetical protein WBC88_10985 [Candidatus Zixiibacteriota bacterium]
MSSSLKTLLLLFLIITYEPVSACTFSRSLPVAFDSTDVMFIGTLKDYVGPLESKKMVNPVFGIAVELTESVHFPDSEGIYEIFPLATGSDCSPMSYTLEELMVYYPIGSTLRIIGKPLSAVDPSIETDAGGKPRIVAWSLIGLHSVRVKYDHPFFDEKESFDYRDFGNMQVLFLDEISDLPWPERNLMSWAFNELVYWALLKDLLELETRTNDEGRFEILSRLVYFRYREESFKKLVDRHIETLEIKAKLWDEFEEKTIELSHKELQCFQEDRGTGVASSMFGTYINKGEFIFYPYYEYYYDQDAEYKPAELGFGVDRDFRGRYRAHEGLIFLGYGITEDLAIELEAAVITAKQYKSEDDTSSMPDELEESGLGDVESQLRWRWSKETVNRPEFFSYFETVFPLQKSKKLIGTQHWEFVLGSGMIKGFQWGTLTFRLAAEFSGEENKLESGEYALEYLKRVSRFFRFFIAVEGTEDEVELITDLQLHVLENAFIRISNAFGVTSKATDYAPEVGILFHF